MSLCIVCYCTVQKRQSHSTCYRMESRMFSLALDKLHVQDFSLGNVHIYESYREFSWCNE